MIAFLGTGLLGGNFTKALLKKGHQVQVWNRTASKASELEASGAKAFASAAEAVSGAERVHLTLKDDATVNEVLAAALPALAKGTVIIDHTTTSADGAKERTRYWKEQGYTYLHAPVFMGPVNALESTGYMMVSGNQEVITKLLPALEQMTGKVLNFGPEEGKAAGIKLIGNLFLVTFTAGLADTLAMSKTLGITIPEVATLFNNWNPGALLPARLQRMTSGNYDKPSWELNMARKDTQLFLDAADKAGTHLAVIPAIATFMDQWIERGHGNNDWTVIGKDAL